MARSAALFGATGVVGGACLRQLASDPAYEAVVTVGRTVPAFAHAKVRAVASTIAGFDDLDRDATGTIDDVFCCLGTTHAKAGSTEAFAAVDRDGVVAACRLAARIGAGRFLLVSAVGASAASPIAYTRVKGEAEDGCRRLADKLQVAIFRPSLLLDPRPEFRLKEVVAAPFLRLLAPVLAGPFSRYRPITAETVARAMIAVAKSLPAGTGASAYEHDEMVALARAP